MANPLRQFENDPVKQKQFHDAVLAAMAECGKSISELPPLDNLSSGAVAVILDAHRLGFGLIADHDTFVNRRYLFLHRRDGSPMPTPELLKRARRHKREIVDWVHGRCPTPKQRGRKR
jgi:hypothetical protein